MKEFAHLVRLNPRSVSNYAVKDDVPTHLCLIALLMSELAYHDIEFKDLVENLDIRKKAVRGSAEIGTFGGSKQKSLELNEGPNV